MPETPPNIDDFNKIAALVFAQLYREFPVPIDIDRAGIAKALGVPEKEKEWRNFILPSGRSFDAMLNRTIGWLYLTNTQRPTVRACQKVWSSRQRAYAP
jgi:hypothetical protein